VKQAKKTEENTRALVSENSSQMPEKQDASTNLMMDLGDELLGLVKKVTATEITPQTVNAACNCAGEINKLLKLNFEMKRAGL